LLCEEGIAAFDCGKFIGVTRAGWLPPKNQRPDRDMAVRSTPDDMEAMRAILSARSFRVLKMRRFVHHLLQTAYGTTCTEMVIHFAHKIVAMTCWEEISFEAKFPFCILR
jgi:hypothetical protein